MGETLEGQRLRKPVGAPGEHATRTLVVVSGVALAAQVATTDYGAGQEAAAGVWFVVGCLLLWLVYSRRSRVARGFIIVTSLAGAVVYGLNALGDGRSAFLALAFLAQAVPLMSRQVRRHVQAAAHA
jgi:hypothetical protein